MAQAPPFQNSSSINNSNSKPLRILCFGDSLTAGFSAWGGIYHPYSEKLADCLEAAGHGAAETTVDGVPGDITGMFMSRILSHFGRDRGPKPYDWTIVLGGTNDLAYAYPPEQIFQNLEKSWNVPLAYRSKILALTVPEAAAGGASLVARRQRLNELIKSYNRENFYVFDFHKALPYHDLSDEDREKYWDDQIHLTPNGYDFMGEKIAEALISIMGEGSVAKATAPPAPAPAGDGAPAAQKSPARRRRVFRDDNHDFVEETGDPSAINKGYIVVRRKDLD